MTWPSPLETIERMIKLARLSWAFSSFFVILSFSAHAEFPVLATTFTNFSGQEVSATAVTLYASRLGRGSGGFDYGYCNTTSGVCNTCQDPAGGDLRKCNTSAIDWASEAVISFPATVTGIPRIMQDNGTTAIGSAATSTVVAGGTAEVRVSWSDLCTYVTADYTCTTTNASKNIVIGIDPFTGGSYSGNLSTATVRQTISIHVVTTTNCDTVDPSSPSCSGGIYKFDMRAGDGKAYLRNLASSNASFPLISGGAAISKLRVYFAPASGTDPCATDITSVRNSSSYFETEVTKPSDAIELGADSVKGLNNLTKYVFKLALVDKANNVFFFTPDNQCGDLLSSTAGARATTYGNHVAIPDQVTGLLADGNSCFIATAAYGSSMDPHVQTFRNFRDRVLMNSDLGKRLVAFYYKYSPRLASTIESSPGLRWIVRGFLWPLWFLSTLVLHLGLMVTLLVLASAVLMVRVLWIALGTISFTSPAKIEPKIPVTAHPLHGGKK